MRPDRRARSTGAARAAGAYGLVLLLALTAIATAAAVARAQALPVPAQLPVTPVPVRGAPVRSAGPVIAIASPSALLFGDATTISGTFTGAAGLPRAGVLAELQQNPYPYSGFVGAASAATGTDGSVAFADLRPVVNTLYRVVVASNPSLLSDAVAVQVSPRSVLRSRPVGLGRVRLTLELRHAPTFRWDAERVFWYIRASANGGFALVARTRAREPRRGSTSASVIVAPSSRHIGFRACLEPPDAAGTGPPGGRCPRSTIEVGAGLSGLTFEGEGRGALAYPGATASAVARDYLAGRSGRTAFAAVDSAGRLFGSHVHRRFGSASLVKAMLLVAYLRRLEQQGTGIEARAGSQLYLMIHVSDNGAASAIFSVVGQGGLSALARSAGMTDFAPSPNWGATQISAADQARFFYDQDSLIPPRFRDYARDLLGLGSSE